MAPDPLQPGDTITWMARGRTKAWGLVDWTDTDGVHVVTRTRGGYHPCRHLIRYHRVTGHYHGRAEHDRHM